MAFNIRLGVAKDGPNEWNLRRELVFQVFRDHQPDVVGVQEAWKFQIDQMLEALPGYAMLGRSRQSDPVEGEWCPIFYRKEKVEVLESGTFWLSDTPDVEGSKNWGNKIPRICTWAHMKEKGSEKTFYFFNTHFDHQSQDSRAKSAHLCLERIAQREATGDPVILLGDFNAGEENEATLTLQKAMLDTFGELHPDVEDRGTFGGWKGRKDGKRIDYVYVGRNQWNVKEARILHDHSADGRYPSDHYPVDAILQMK